MSGGTKDSGRLRLADASIRIDSMPTDGRDLRLTVGEEERAQVAAHLGVSAIERLDAQLRAARFRGGFRVQGRLLANIVQPSVISLEPVRQAIEEEVDRVFLPTGGKVSAESADAEVFVDLEGDDVPDHFEGTEADLTDLIVETLALGIDPYPRLEGENVDDLGLQSVDEDFSPFARLKALRDGNGEG